MSIKPTIRLVQGDVPDITERLSREYGKFSAVLTDPPYGLSSGNQLREMLVDWALGREHNATGVGFKNSAWDYVVPSPQTWQAIFDSCLPGSVMMVCSGTRTSDLVSISARLGGWLRYDNIGVFGRMNDVSWVQGEAMPKSHDLSKAADKKEGLEGKVTHAVNYPDIRNGHGREYGSSMFGGEQTGSIEYVKREPVSDLARAYYGYGTALTPAHEDIMLFRSPLDDTYLNTMSNFGTGALNIIDAIIGVNEYWNREHGYPPTNKLGRWPKNAVFVCECEGDHHDDDCPIAELTRQAGESTSRMAHRGAGINGNLFVAPEYASTIRGVEDSGSKARFFYTPKASRKERDFGMASKNLHPTIKPVRLMKYIARMILPPEQFRDEAVLYVPFAGTGSEIIGAALAGWKNIVGVEMEESYVEIAQQRIAAWVEAAQQLDTTDIDKILGSV